MQQAKRKPLVKAICSRPMLVSFIMGFSCGLPLLLTVTLLQAWMSEEGVDLTVIGMMTLVGIPYTVKFLWAPVLDRYRPPFLGRRRGWLIISQISLMITIAALGAVSPARNPWMLSFIAFLVTFFSASQDIVTDAYRREDLADEELGLGSSLYVNGYRIGMLSASGGGLILSDQLSFPLVYLIMAFGMLPGMITTILTPEPEVSGKPGTFREAVVGPLTEYFGRDHAFLMLAFILLYKIGDTMASAMTTPFYLELGFTKTEIGTIAKIFGFWATTGGALLGGIVLLRLGIHRSLWIFGVFQGLSTAGFALLAAIGRSWPALAACVAFENFTGGMGTSAYVAFMASITNKKFTAMQYALLSSLMGVPRVVASAPTGYVAKIVGWEFFFIGCAVIALPGMLLLLRFAPWFPKEEGREDRQIP